MVPKPLRRCFRFFRRCARSRPIDPPKKVQVAIPQSATATQQLSHTIPPLIKWVDSIYLCIKNYTTHLEIRYVYIDTACKYSTGFASWASLAPRCKYFWAVSSAINFRSSSGTSSSQNIYIYIQMYMYIHWIYIIYMYTNVSLIPFI